MADTEASLESVTETARHVIANIGTVGVSLGGRIVPGCDHSFNLEENRMELGPVPCYLSAAKQNTVVHNGSFRLAGLGIHGEPGIRQIPPDTAANVVATVVRLLITDGESICQQYCI